MSAEVVVGLDVGTTGVKGVAVEPDGSVAAVAEQGYPLSTPRAGWSEQDPEDWWRATRAVLAAARGPRSGDERDRRDRSLRPDARPRRSRRADASIRPAILWNDQRTGAECAEIEERIGLERLIAPDRQSRADGVHGAEAALAAPPRAGRLRAGSRG